MWRKEVGRFPFAWKHFRVRTCFALVFGWVGFRVWGLYGVGLQGLQICKVYTARGLGSRI